MSTYFIQRPYDCILYIFSNIIFVLVFTSNTLTLYFLLFVYFLEYTLCDWHPYLFLRCLCKFGDKLLSGTYADHLSLGEAPLQPVITPKVQRPQPGSPRHEAGFRGGQVQQQCV